MEGFRQFLLVYVTAVRRLQRIRERKRTETEARRKTGRSTQTTRRGDEYRAVMNF